MTRFRILSIDGGGIKGVFPAAFLSHLEATLDGTPIGRYFDLIAGTSTGGIIALGLGLGLSAKETLDFYTRFGPEIFPRTTPKWLLRATKYDVGPLKTALQRVFESKRLGDSSTRLLIPSFNATTGSIHIYKTAHHERLRMDFRVPALDVALATSAAPVFLPPHRTGEGVIFVDGGIWANNPVGLAVTEAISMLGRTGCELDVLSIGCTNTPHDFAQRGRGWKFWALRAIEAAIEGQSFAALGTAQHLAGHANVFRFSPAVTAGRFSLDNTSGIEGLKAFGYSEARGASRELNPRFFTSPTEPFKPFYT